MRKPGRKLERLFGARLGKAALGAQLDALHARLDGEAARAMARALRPAGLRVSLSFHMKDRLLAEALGKRRGLNGPKPGKPRRPDGGEPIPALPRPKPRPLSGGAAAPIEPGRGKLRTLGPHSRKLMNVTGGEGSSLRL